MYYYVHGKDGLTRTAFVRDVYRGVGGTTIIITMRIYGTRATATESYRAQSFFDAHGTARSRTRRGRTTARTTTTTTTAAVGWRPARP